MKKLIIKSVIMVVIMVGISNYALYIMTGKSPFTMPSKLDFSLSAPSTDDVKRTLSGGKETVYKWTDAAGKVHYASEPPEALNTAKKMEIDPNTNLIRGIEVTATDDSSNTNNEPPVAEPNNTLPGGVYSPENVKKLVNDAKNVQKLMDERNKALEKVSSGQ